MELNTNNDWTGDSNSVFKTLGASNHSDEDREENDFYATDPIAINKLIDSKLIELPKIILEPCCGTGCLSKRLEEFEHIVISEDLIDRGYGKGKVDFFKRTEMPENCSCILTNFPYKYALEMTLHSLEILPERGLLISFLKTTFLEGKKRFELLFKSSPPKFVLQFSERVICAKNAEFDETTGSAVSYAWIIWEKGWKGDTVIKWI